MFENPDVFTNFSENCTGCAKNRTSKNFEFSMKFTNLPKIGKFDTKNVGRLKTDSLPKIASENGEFVKFDLVRPEMTENVGVVLLKTAKKVLIWGEKSDVVLFLSKIRSKKPSFSMEIEIEGLSGGRN